MIQGKRIVLRAIEYEDLPLIVKWRNDPDVYQHFYEHEPLSLEMQKRWFEKLLDRADEKLWIIEARDGNKPIGTVGLEHIDWRNRKAEWGRFLIYPDEYLHGGYGSEVESLVLKYVFEHMNLNRLYWEVFADNTKVIDLHKGFGFKREGVFRKHIYKEGEYRDVVSLALLKEDYLTTSAKKVRSFLE